MGPVLNKANGHIVQVDWNETDETSFSFIHNKPDLSNVGITEDRVVEIVTDHIDSIVPTEEELIELIHNEVNTILNGEW
jgi:hypothetical protein